MFNTMKRKMFFRLTAICLVAVSALIACTQDYGSDIQELQNKVDKLDKDVAALDALIKAGNVITDVSAITGGTRVTLSDGSHFDVKNGIDGNDGEDGAPGTVWKIDDATGNWFYDNGDGSGFHNSGKPARGAQGPQGDPGLNGEPGASAYEVAKANGFEGTEAEWLESLHGATGATGMSAYEEAVAKGYTGTEDEWLASLKGDKGDTGATGKSAYELAKDNGYTGSETEWLASLVGAKGEDGKSAYELSGFEGTLEEWIASLKGAKGDKGTNGDYYYPCTDKEDAEG